MTSNIASNINQQAHLSALGARGELCLEATQGKNRIIVLKYNYPGSTGKAYLAEILKEDDSQLLVLPGSVAFLKPISKLALEHYGVRESGVSGFIKSQVTGESFVMTEVEGTGTIRLTPSSGQLAVKQYQNTKFCIPNINVAYVKALLGSYEITNPQKTKTALPIIYSELKMQNSLVLIEAEEFYEVQVIPGNAIDVESSEVVFWTGELNLEELKDNAGSEGNLIRFSGVGTVYLSLSI
jgi:uncharacterized protein (AIM24 family)